MGICYGQIINVKLTTRKLKEYYLKLGYEIKDNEIYVDAKDLKQTAKINVKCICDICGAEFFRKRNKIHDINSMITCKNCKSYKIKDTNLKKYGVENVSQCDEIRKKIKNTNLEKYGVESFTESEIFKQKRIDTNMNKYGTKYFVESEIFKNKNKETLLMKYNVDHNLKIPNIIEKRKNTWITNYNVDHPWKSKQIQNKIKNTNLKRYGVENAMSSEQIKDKVINTNLKRYGCKFTLQNKEVREKIKDSMILRYGIPNVYCKIPCSKQQFHIGMLLNGIINKYIDKECKYADVLLENEKLIIEYDGGGHDRSVKHGYPQELFIKNEIEKENAYINNGYKLIRIISKKDLLPEDNEIINMINNAKEYLQNSDIVKISIDECQLIVNDLKINISFKKLRKIKGDEIICLKSTT